MEWIIGFIVICAFIGWINEPSGNTKSRKGSTGKISSGSARAQPQVQIDSSSAEIQSDLEQKRRCLAEAKAAHWLTEQQKKIEDALPTNEMRKQFNEIKAKHFPGSQPIPLLQEKQDAGSTTKPSALAQFDKLAIAEPLRSPSRTSQARLQRPHDHEKNPVSDSKKSSVVCKNTAGSLIGIFDPPPSIIDKSAGSSVSIPNRSFQAAEVREELWADDVKENGAAAKEVAGATGRVTSSHDPLGTTSLKKAVDSLNIKKLYHFTRVSNLRSIAEHGLLSITDLRGRGINHVKNDEYRLDKRLHGISVSISFPNSRMFYRYRREVQLQRWAIFELNPSLLYELDCLFCRYNAADKRISSIVESELRGIHALNSMFREEEGLLRAPYLKEYDPTDEQAEVLVLQRIDLRYVTGVILEDQDSYEAAAAALDGSLPLRLSTTDAALFNARGYVRRSSQEASAPANSISNTRSEYLIYDGEIPF